MIRGKYLSSMDDISPVLSLRAAMLSPEDPEATRDAHDEMCFYALALDDDGNPKGTGRLYLDEDSRFRLGTICVLPEARGNGLGDLIARMLLFRALDLNAASLRAVCPVNAVGFLLRYGMHPVGEVLFCHGTACRMMVAAAEEINLEGSCHRNGRCNGCSAEDCANCPSEAK